MIPYKFNPLGISRSYKEFYTYLTFTALEANSKVKLTAVGSPNVSALQYKKNNGSWTNYVIDTDIQLEEIGDYVQFRNNSNQLSTSASDYVQFVMTKKIASSGNIQSLLNWSKTVPHHSFIFLFQNCTSLVTPPDLLGETLGFACYDRLFYNCTSLIKTPDLPAATLTDYCYYDMFNGCASLTEAPLLSAETLAYYCYTGMFRNCTSLTEAPKLPATTLKDHCYDSMFRNCTSLKETPKLPASGLAISCYAYMFRDCTSLSGSSELSATTLANECYIEMFENCTSLTEAPSLPAITLGAGCYNGMFLNCTSLKDMPIISAYNIVGTYNLRFMFGSCTSLTGVVDLLPINLVGDNYNSMFINCSSLEIAPHIHLSGIQVPLTNMFYNCPNLKEIDVDAVTWDNTNTQNWLYNNQTSGTFYCPSELKIPSRDVNGVPSSWNIVPKDVILGQIIEENGVKKFAELSFDGPLATIDRIETFDNVYSFNKITGTGTFNYGEIQSEDIIELGQIINDNGTQKFASLEFNGTTPTLKEIKTYTNVYEYNKISNLPYKKRLNYIESTGTQYIDTGIAPDFAGGDSIEISYFRADYTGSMPCVCGSRETTLRNGIHLLANNYAVYGSDGYMTYGGSDGFPVTQANYTVAVNDNYVVFNGTQRMPMPYRVTCSLAMTLFALRSGSSILVYYSGMKLYNWKYYHNGVLAQYFIPVLDNNDVPCLYDTVSGTFFYNAGTGTFNYGEI